MSLCKVALAIWLWKGEGSSPVKEDNLVALHYFCSGADDHFKPRDDGDSAPELKA